MQLDEAEDTGFFTLEKDGTSELLFAVLKASELKGVAALRVFDRDGRFLDSVPADFLLGDISASDLADLKGFQPVSRFVPEAMLGDYFPLLSGETDEQVPLLEVLLPLHRSGDSEILGVAQFLIEGEAIAAEFARLDLNLITQGGVASASGAIIIIAILCWAFHRINKSQRLLEERSARLIKANAELSLVAKTSAVGAIASHLIHGLKNPLSGLEAFFSQERLETPDDRLSAVESAERMRRMIDEVVGVLRDDETDASYTLTVVELRELLENRARPVAEKAGVAFQCDGNGIGELDNRQSNLLLLVLINLVENALEATPAGGHVSVRFEIEDDNLEIRVRDTGTGISDRVRQSLFTPAMSGKAGGTGIGLTISRQLARQIGAELSLESTGGEGSCFLVRIAIGKSENERSGNRLVKMPE